MPWTLMHPHISFCTFRWLQSGCSFSSMARRIRHPFFPKTSWNVDLSDQRTRFHCLSVHLRWLSGPENSAAFLCKIYKCLPLCIIQFEVAFLDAAADCVEWQWFSKVLPSPCGYVHHGSMTVSQTIPPEGSMVTHIQQSFSALGIYTPIFPLTPWIFSQYYELWMVKDLNYLQSCAEKHCALNWLDNSLRKFGTKCWTTTHPCLQRLKLWWMLLLYSILITSPVTS